MEDNLKQNGRRPKKNLKKKLRRPQKKIKKLIGCDIIVN